MEITWKWIAAGLAVLVVILFGVIAFPFVVLNVVTDYALMTLSWIVDWIQFIFEPYSI